MLGNNVLTGEAPVRPQPSPAPPPSRWGSQWVIVAFGVLALGALAGGFAWAYVTSDPGGSSFEVDLSSSESSGDVVDAPLSTAAPSPVTAEQADQAKADAFVAQVEAGAQAYADRSAAVAAGYRPIVVGSRGRSVEYLIRPNGRDGAVDPASPDGLVYRDTDGQLVGAFFVTLSGRAHPDPAGALTSWYQTSIRSTSGEGLEVLPVWFFEGATHPFAADYVAAGGR